MVASGPAPEAAPKPVPEPVHGAALSVAHGLVPELVPVLSVDLALLLVHGFGREAVREAGKEVVPVSLVLLEVQKA